MYFLGTQERRKGTGMGCREEGNRDCSIKGLIQSPVEEKSMEGYPKLRAQPGVPLGMVGARGNWGPDREWACPRLEGVDSVLWC